MTDLAALAARPHPRRRAGFVVAIVAVVVGLFAAPATATAPRRAPLERGPAEVEPLTDRSASVAAGVVGVAPTVVPTTIAPIAAVTTTLVPTTSAPPVEPVSATVDFGGGLVTDVVVPGGPGPHPMVVYVHGGGWISGDHREIPTEFGLHGLHERGWAVASIGYELASRDRGVDAAHQVVQVSQVLRWLGTDGADRFGLSRRVVGVGHSAGAHLLALAATTVDPAFAPDLVVGIAGIYDFGADVQESPLLRAVLPDALGCVPDACPPGRIEALTPGTHADAADPGFVLVHGDADPVAPVRTAVDLARRLADAGVAAELVVVEGGDHHGGVAATVREVLASVLACDSACR